MEVPAPGGSSAWTSLILRRSRSQYWASSCSRTVFSSSTVICDRPSALTELTRFRSGICWIAFSRRRVTSSSTCSGVAPGYWVEMMALRMVNSGNSSCPSPKKDTTPPTASSRVIIQLMTFWRRK